MDYAEAVRDALEVEIDSVRIPYASLPVLIRSKSTYREQDRADLLHLRELLQRKQDEKE